MKKIIVFTLAVMAVFVCSQCSSGEQKSNNETAEAPKVDGEKIFKTYCVTCHGIYGDMGASGAFNLKTSTLPLEERINVITNGRKAMTPFKDLLTPEKIKAVAEYTLTLKQ